MLAPPIDGDQIVVTASRFGETETESPASILVIDSQRIERLGEPLVPALLRLAPSVAVTTQGPAGLLTEVRIRGAENNHSLLFIDGIRANDPATGDFARFELLNADLVSRIEVVRGPQSALWGSDAIGGVVAVQAIADRTGYAASAEGGAFGLLRGSAGGALVSAKTSLAAAFGWQQAEGIDSFGAPGGDKDGYRNLSGRARVAWKPASWLNLGVSAFALSGRSQFDGYDPATFERTDTLDHSRNRLAAGRAWANFGEDGSPWRGRVGATVLASSNRNLLDDDPVNRTGGTRRSIDAQVERRLRTGAIDHQLLLAAEAERETFKARGTISGLATDQDRDRAHQALAAQWQASGRGVTGDLAVRRDVFNRFKDATTL
ncbi:MAG TPA: TonB-dependent receptor plug domain-containing protein, partial [Sphingomicrobium sp.]|nr:TonB-dependent receptor plug domain-containing protein [Sphingomicrobium sp.]